MLFMEIYSLGNIDKSICNLYVCYKEVIFKVKIIKYMYVIRQMFFFKYFNLLFLVNCYKVDIFIMFNYVFFNNKKMLYEKVN